MNVSCATASGRRVISVTVGMLMPLMTEAFSQTHRGVGCFGS
jgi:hypothetical protein